MLMKRYIPSFLLLLILLPLASCQKDIPVESLTISPSSMTLFVGDSREISVQYFPEEATNLDELQIYSTNEKIVRYQDGKVTGVSGGDAAISASRAAPTAESIVFCMSAAALQGGW